MNGSHVYAGTGTYTVTTSINDVGGATTSTSCKTLAYGFPSSNAFVLGDKTVASAGISGTASVNWWGSQWAKNNSFTGGGAPNSMKGFAEKPSTLPRPAVELSPLAPATAQGSFPPAGAIPAYMGVIVSSRVSQSGSTISGDIKRIVIVRTSPGYANNPGHDGKGFIVADVCP